ncbi:hypothetical protein E4U16_005807 [Claviceps sp. LM84 group G4]|nr:hypothetical protein E4U16_005807 [Claviceps sp. LM84 group G4]
MSFLQSDDDTLRKWTDPDTGKLKFPRFHDYNLEEQTVAGADLFLIRDYKTMTEASKALREHAAVLDHISGEASTRMTLHHKVFRGLSFRYHNVTDAEQRSKQIAAMPSVKQMWSVKLVSAQTATNVQVIDMPQTARLSGEMASAQPKALGFTGAAPDVTSVLTTYKMFGCDGLAGDDMILPAYSKAFEDGANIITVSIGEA